MNDLVVAAQSLAWLACIEHATMKLPSPPLQGSMYLTGFYSAA